MSPRWSAAFLISGLACCSFAADTPAQIGNDVQLRAMWDEMQRSRTLQLPGLEKPYFVRFAISDGEDFSVSASLGGLTHARETKFRRPTVEIRVGSYEFDQTNSTYATPLNTGLAPLDDDYLALRDAFWLASDTFYKVAAVRITSKRNALRDVAAPDTTPDFAKAQTATILQSPAKFHVDEKSWTDEVTKLSSEFLSHPALLSSHVRFFSVSSTYRITTSEGSLVRVPQGFTTLEIEASGLAADGRTVHNSYLLAAEEPSELPGRSTLKEVTDTVARDTELLQQAPMADAYSGPVLFEQQAAAQLMAELMADAARLTRKPVAPPGSNQNVALDSVWATRVGSSVAPVWLSIEDDPKQTSFDGEKLAGNYDVDDEGVPAERVSIVEKGVLKGFLMSRLPVRNWNGSNGHGRLPGTHGSEATVIGNLFVRATQTVPEAQMKAKLIEKVKTAGLPFGLLIRKLDFPSTSSQQEMQDISRQAQKGGFTRTITPPILAYRVYVDGREELVRGIRFGEVSAKDLRDLAAVSDHPYVLNYINHGTAFDFADIGGNVTLSSVICPSLLLDSIDTERAEDEVPKPPVVPPPALASLK